MSQVIRGVHRENPGTPRYEEFYDPDLVRTYLASWGPTSSLSTEQLRNKAIVLVKIASMRRAADLAAIRLSTQRIFHDRWEFRACLIKEIGVSQGRMLWSAPILVWKHRQVEYCPVHALQLYLDRVAALRPFGLQSLFLSTRSPFVPLGSQTLNSITTKILRLAGVGEVFTSHSTRMAEASSRLAQGQAPLQVMRQGGWSSTGVFHRHYARVTLVAPASAPVQESM